MGIEDQPKTPLLGGKIEPVKRGEIPQSADPKPSQPDDPSNDLYGILDSVDFTPTAFLLGQGSTSARVTRMRDAIVAKMKTYLQQREQELLKAKEVPSAKKIPKR